MAIYCLNAQIMGRSAGRSATGAAAYRAGERIHDDRAGQTYDYTRRRGEMETEILSPAGAPERVQDRSRLWNEVEKSKRRADAQVARKIVLALPVELTREQQRELIRSYVQAEFISKSMVADVTRANLVRLAVRGLEYEERREQMKAEQAREQLREQNSRCILDRKRSRADREIDRSRYPAALPIGVGPPRHCPVGEPSRVIIPCHVVVLVQYHNEQLRSCSLRVPTQAAFSSKSRLFGCVSS